METVNQLKDIILNGGNITAEQAYDLVEHLDEVRDEIRAAAAEVTRKFCPPVFDSCSIINARSGKCPENCKWCAQSAHHKTSVSVYPLVSREECMKAADLNRSLGVRRFSLVTSGRALRGDELDRACSYYKEMEREGGLKLCASMGLLSAEDLQKLYDSGVHRYHCNLEAAPSLNCAPRIPLRTRLPPSRLRAALVLRCAAAASSAWVKPCASAWSWP